MKKAFAVFLLLSVCGTVIVAGQEEKKEEEKKEEAQEQSSPPLRTRKELYDAGMERTAKDAMFYSREERTEIQNLYKLWRTRKGKERDAVATNLLRRFPKSNPTGCVQYFTALDYAGQKRIRLLKQVIQNYDDCWFGFGVQVGPMARYHLINILMETGKQKEAEKYREELRTRFPDAIDGNGKLISELLKN